MKQLFDSKKGRAASIAVILVVLCIALLLVFGIGSPHLRLVGVEPGQFAIIEDESTNSQDVFSLNESVVDGVRLVEVGKDHVKVASREGTEELRIRQSTRRGESGESRTDAEPQPQLLAANSASDDAGARIELVAPPSDAAPEPEPQPAAPPKPGALKQEDLHKLISEAAAAARDAIPSTVSADGKAIGVRFDRIAEDSPLAKLGISSTDVIVSLGQSPTGNPVALLDALQDALLTDGTGKVDVAIRRDEKLEVVKLDLAAPLFGKGPDTRVP